MNVYMGIHTHIYICIYTHVHSYIYVEHACMLLGAIMQISEGGHHRHRPACRVGPEAVHEATRYISFT